MKFTISDIGERMLKMQADLAEQYGYKKQPEDVGEQNMQAYINEIPECFANPAVTVESDKPGYEIAPQNVPLFSKEGTKIADKYDRIVVGHYGAFIEIDPQDVVLDNIKCKPGQEYRINNPRYAERVKYQWMTTKDGSDCKLYFQQKGVTYADYKPEKWYVSPYEVLDAKELEKLGSVEAELDGPEI